MKLWDKGVETPEHVLAFTIGDDRETDKRLAVYDVRASRAHAAMLYHCGLLHDREWLQLQEGLQRLEEEVSAADFVIPETSEDIHSYLELHLTEWYGDSGKKIHTARSRNDQVLTAIHLYLKAEIAEISKKTRNLGMLLCELAEKYEHVYFPGYTHTQVAMPCSGAMWLSGYAECLSDDLLLLEAVFRMTDQNPLGTAAGYGSTFPIDRQLTTNLMDFGQMRVSPVGAQRSRGKLEQSTVHAFAQVGTTIGNLANDAVWMCCQNLDYLRFSGETTTGSSIMPHKKNPDVLELIRAKSAVLSAIPAEINLLTRNLFMGYHRDFQLLKAPLFRGTDIIHEMLDMMNFMLQHLELHGANLTDERFQGIFSVDQVAERVQQGDSFRDAYRYVAENPAYNRSEPMKTSHAGSLYVPDLERIRCKLQTTGLSTKTESKSWLVE